MFCIEFQELLPNKLPGIFPVAGSKECFGENTNYLYYTYVLCENFSVFKNHTHNCPVVKVFFLTSHYKIDVIVADMVSQRTYLYDMCVAWVEYNNSKGFF